MHAIGILHDRALLVHAVVLVTPSAHAKPAGQGVGSFEESAQTDPAGQMVHAVAPSSTRGPPTLLVVILPAPHREGLIHPRSGPVQEVVPSRQKYPALQGFFAQFASEVAPVTSEMKPAGHATSELAPQLLGQ